MAGTSKGLKEEIPRIRKSNGGVDFGEIDRVSDLPDNLLHHVLSFLDSRSMVRSSVLSRRWRCLWKDVPALNFHRRSFHDSSDFKEHVGKFLSLRSDSAAVCSVTFDFMQDEVVSVFVLRPVTVLDIDLFDSVMKYAASHGTDEHRLHQLSIHSNSDFKDSGLAASIRAHGHHKYIKTLKLVGLDLLDCGTSGWGLDFVTTLELQQCKLCSSVTGSEPLVPFPNLPRLNYLKILNCTSPGCLELSGFELLGLEIQQLHDNTQLEVFAPKLKSFVFWGYALDLFRLDLPSLDSANIRSWWVIHPETSYRMIEEVNRALMKLLRALHNVSGLNIRFDREHWDELPAWGSCTQKPWKRHQFPLNAVKSLMEPEASPFTRLKTLKVQYPQEPPPTPYQVLRYFSDGSPEEKSITFERVV